MQTFLPLPGFQASAATLDDDRLGKQRAETKQILRALLPDHLRTLLPPLPRQRSPLAPKSAQEAPRARRESGRRGWVDHPATAMWRGYEGRLALYGRAVCLEWRRRGCRDTVLPQFVALIEAIGVGPAPPWLGREDIHASHRSNLLRKLPAHYARFGWSEPPDLPYVWPV